MEERKKRTLGVCQRLSDKLDAAAVQLECERPRTIINVNSEEHTVLVWALHEFWSKVMVEDESKTNSDKIREMSDEELAELLLDGCRGSDCENQPKNEFGSVLCFECRKNWLQQPYERRH